MINAETTYSGKQTAGSCDACGWQPEGWSISASFCGDCGARIRPHVRMVKDARSDSGAQRQAHSRDKRGVLIGWGMVAVGALVILTLVVLSIPKPEPSYVNGYVLEDNITTKLERAGGAYGAAMLARYEVECPKSVESIPGLTFECSVRSSSGHWGQEYQHWAIVEIQSADGAVTWEVR